MAARVQGAVEEDVHARRHSGDVLNYVAATVRSINCTICVCVIFNDIKLRITHNQFLQSTSCWKFYYVPLATTYVSLAISCICASLYAPYG